MKRLLPLAAVCSLAICGTASADMAVGVRGGTLGAGLDLNIGLTETLNARVGYSGFNYDKEIEETDVTYDGELKLRNASALLDWHPFNGGFRLSAGIVANSTKVDVDGEPTNGTYTIDDEVFTAAEVGSVNGKVEMGNSVSPYFGFGWGNPVDQGGRVTFLLDVGAMYAGKPDVKLAATCGTAATPQVCAQLQDAVQN
ncbi:MAG: hypothetical protein ABW110_16980, partial [Steroidobacteraceae bacterium]